MTRVVMLAGKATGGIGVHVRDLAAGLAAAGTEVAIVTDPLTARTFGLGGARLLWPDPRRPDPRRLGELRRLLRGADVVHAHGHQAGGYLQLLLLLAGQFLPLIGNFAGLAL